MKKTELWRTFLELKRKKELIIPFPAVVIAIFAAFTAYNGFNIADRSEELEKWYDENHEAILFGRYLRVNENKRWNYWHNEWVNDCYFHVGLVSLWHGYQIDEFGCFLSLTVSCTSPDDLNHFRE